MYTYNIFKFVIGNIYENVSYGNNTFCVANLLIFSLLSFCCRVP